jgi:cobalt-zinc-cadmium efflux system protein
MLTDAAALGLSLVALSLAARPAKGAATFGLKRAEILSAQFNGASLLVLAALIVFEGIRRLIAPAHVQGRLMLAVALVGIVVNLAASFLLAKANRQSLNVEGSFQHILTDLYAFIGTAIAAGVILASGFERADPIASLLVAGLMLRAAYGLLRDSGADLFGDGPEGHRSRPGRPHYRRKPGRRLRPRPARLGGLIGHAEPLGPRLGALRRRLSRRPAGARSDVERALQDRAHDASGRSLDRGPADSDRID